jgi:hypothetical protein
LKAVAGAEAPGLSRWLDTHVQKKKRAYALQFVGRKAS